MSETDTKILSGPVWAYVFIGTLLLYSFSLAPSVMWGDSAGLAIMVREFSLDPAADGHPLYIMLGRVFSWLPGDDLGVKLNFMSAFFGAMAVMLTYLIVEEITGEGIPAVIAAGALAMSHAFWLHAVITEVYILNSFFLGLLVWLLLKWKADTEQDRYLYWAALAYGLALSHHLVLGLIGPAILYFIIIYGGRGYFNWKRILIIAALLIVGSAPYWIVLIKWMYFLPPKAGEVAEAGKVLDAVTGREHKQFLFRFFFMQFVKNLVLYLGYLFYQFPVWGFGLAIYGLFKLIRQELRLAIFLGLLILCNSLLFMGGSYLFWNTNYTFFIQDYLLYAVFIGLGCNYMLNGLSDLQMQNRRASVLLVLLLATPAVAYQVTPRLIKAMNIEVFQARPLPFRNNEEYFLTPGKYGYRGPAQYAKAAFQNIEPGAILIADYTPGVVIEYFQKVRGERRDIRLVYTTDAAAGVPGNDLKPYVDKHYHEAPVYLADLIRSENWYNVANLEREYSIQTKWPVYKVVKNKP